MPTYPHNLKCAELGCKAQRSKINSYCLNHGGKDNVQARHTDSMYQTPAWRSVRQRQLSIQPLCQACLSRGKIEQAHHVDHVFPWKHIGKHAFLNNIFQSLCQADHSHKTGLERQGKYMHYMPDGDKEYTCNDYSFLVRMA